MRYLLSGGGTGGHITPILAVAEELKIHQKDCSIVYVGERNSKFFALFGENTAIDKKIRIFAGKFRRYHGQSLYKSIIDVPTIFKNLRDVLYVIIGFFQSIFILHKFKPDIVFLKGGYVGVPIGLAAAIFHIPIVTHDSDAIPGLANRIVSKWAKVHTTALPAENYKYPKLKVNMVGVLVEKNYQHIDINTQKKYKKQLNLPQNKPLLLITGGSSGAARLNIAFIKIIEMILEKNRDLWVIHQVGVGKQSVYGDFKHDRLKVVEFMNPMHIYTGAADLIVSRAGANALAEFGVQGKPCIVVPNPDLTGGHQVKNAQILEEQGSIVVVYEENLLDENVGLSHNINILLNDDDKRSKLAENLHKTTVKNAANAVASILINLSDKKNN